jgi:hypothetical protein
VRAHRHFRAGAARIPCGWPAPRNELAQRIDEVVQAMADIDEFFDLSMPTRSIRPLHFTAWLAISSTILRLVQRKNTLFLKKSLWPARAPSPFFGR